MGGFTIASMVRENARRSPDAVAVVEIGRPDRWMSHAELDARSNQVAAALRADGVAPGDRVLYFGYNRIEFFEMFYGAAKAGVTIVPLNWGLDAAEIKALVADLGCRAAVVDSAYADRIAVSNMLIIGSSYETWRDIQPADDLGYVGNPNDVVLQPYTSGTTGVPKGVPLTNENIDALLAASRVLQYDDSSVQLASMPNYHIGGCVFPLIASQARGALVIVNRFSAESVMQMIEQYRITHLNVAPAMLNLMLDVHQASPRDVSTVRLIIYGASPVSERTLQRTRALLGVPLLQEYASTECLAITLLGPSDHKPELLHSVGRAFAGVDLTIRDPTTGTVLPVGATGEVCVRSDQCAKRYWGRPEESAKLLTTDGYTRTSDVGYLDGRGYLYLSGRLNDLIITGGENVYPAEVESVLSRHPKIKDVAVVGIPDEMWGELVTAAVVANQDTALTAEMVLDWGRRQLAGYRRVRQVFVVSELPRNQTGKVQRDVIRDMVAGSSLRMLAPQASPEEQALPALDATKQSETPHSDVAEAVALPRGEPHRRKV